ncbi:hypothetical protein MKX01_007941 [Papaver californicum]|nr:hypothetical protein MKX01_007941 [Papaver californicum]
MNQNDGKISYETLRQQRIKENMERMQKLGISDLSKKLKSKPFPHLPKKSLRKKKNEVEISEPTRRSSRLEKLTPVSYRYNRPMPPNRGRNHMEEEDEEDEDEEEEEDENEDENEKYLTRKWYDPDLYARRRRSSRLHRVTRVNYTEISPKTTNIEEEEGENWKDILGGEEGKPEIDTEEHEKGAKQPVSVNRSLHFDNVDHSPPPIESVNSSTGGKNLDVGEVTSPQSQT